MLPAYMIMYPSHNLVIGNPQKKDTLARAIIKYLNSNATEASLAAKFK